MSKREIVEYTREEMTNRIEYYWGLLLQAVYKQDLNQVFRSAFAIKALFKKRDVDL